MSADKQASSFGDPTTLPPTPKETPTSADFPPSVFETPKAGEIRLDNNSNGWTPQFAEEYSVFNSTPGNLRGTSGAFPGSASLYPLSPHHKRLLSIETIDTEIPSHANHFSTTSSLPLPLIDPSHQPHSTLPVGGPLLSPQEIQFQTSLQQSSPKKPRRVILLDDQPQTATPPSSARKGERRLAPKPRPDSMQHDGFEPDYMSGNPHQQHHLQSGFENAPMDMFGMPLSAPPTLDDNQNFWDHGNGMDVDFSMSVSASFQASNHGPMNSLDWGKTNEMFQETGVVNAMSQANNSPLKKERLLAPKLTSLPNVDMSMADESVFAHSFSLPGDDPFGMNGVNPGLLFSQHAPAGMELSLDSVAQSVMLDPTPSQQPLASPTEEPRRGQTRRLASARDMIKDKKNERPTLSSPVKPSSRPGLLRSASESRGRKPAPRGNNLPSLAPAVRPGPSARNGRSASQGSRINGRTSPLKLHNRLTSLGSIPENSGPRTRTSVRFTIDSRGRARAETTVIVDGDLQTRPRRRGGEERGDIVSSGDESSSSDDEPIIVPSRNSSFSLPEPSRPAYFRPPHGSQRSFSDQSTSSLGIYYAEPSAFQNEGDSDAETVMNVAVNGSRSGDAMSELRKVREDRQKRLPSLNTNHRITSGAPYSSSSTVSPSKFTEASRPHPSTDRGNQIRCICNTTLSQINGSGYMVQCESCEMWLHGKCVNITRQTLPRVYICAYCANTPNAHGARGRETRRVAGSHSRPSASSPLAHKVRSFR
ncbi:hypothetical protein F5Y18DRAFT_58329 [Xylariaceae sp. FL1019]|nr:hypothetical protein F5Y18DRAFT_58329 [Xylariaceae sp. FL1019]